MASIKIKIDKAKVLKSDTVPETSPSKLLKRKRKAGEEDSEGDSHNNGASKSISADTVSRKPRPSTYAARQTSTSGNASISDDKELAGSLTTGASSKPLKNRSSRQRIVSDDDEYEDNTLEPTSTSPHVRDSKPSAPHLKGKAALPSKGKNDKEREKTEKKAGVRDLRRVGLSSGSLPDDTREEPPSKKKKVGGAVPPKRVSDLNESVNLVPLLSSRTPAARGHTGSADYDLTSKDALQSLFMSVKKPSTPKCDIHEKMRQEARKARAEVAATDTFDLMAGSEKIRAFEFQLEARQAIHPPQTLLAPLMRLASTTLGEAAR